MTISVISDLHCRNKSFPPSFDPKKLEPADVLVVAGDLGTRPTYEKIEQKLKDETEGKFKSVYCIKGNHDYYATDPHWIKHQKVLRWPSDADNKILLLDDYYAIVGTPLWSPIFDKVNHVKFGLNDYNYITSKAGDGTCATVTPEHITETFWKNLQWLEDTVDELAHDRTVIVVTHHLPIPELIEERFRGDEINEGFCVLEPKAVERIKAIKTRLWIHGHSHAFLDTTIDGTRYIRNPYGYEWISHDYGDSSREATGFVMNTIVEV